MSAPERGVSRSVASAGEIEDEPRKVIATVVEGVDDEPQGVLEKWSDTAWIYADADSVREME